MARKLVLPSVLAALAMALLQPPGQAAAQEEPRFRALVFSETAAFRHPSIPNAVATIEQLGSQHNFAVDATEDSSVFTEENLLTYDVVIFALTTGDVLTEVEQASFESYIRGGGGYVGIHSASDTEYDWAWYGGLVGAYFQSHPDIQQATIKVADRVHPATANLPERWIRTDEWYNFRTNPRGNVHVLATLDETTYSAGSGAMGVDHPIAWCQDYDGGRSFYTGLGHTPETYNEPAFIEHLLKGIETAAGVMAADCGGTVWSSFERITLDDTTENPMKMAVAPDGRVLYLERISGQVRLYDPATQSTTVAATLNVFTEFENGLIGVAVDPGFLQNGWVYLYYSATGTAPCPPSDQGATVCGVQRLSRFTLNGSTLDLASERVLLEIPHQRDVCCHEAGDLEFDSQGNLYLSTGDDTNPFASNGYAPIDERPGRSSWDAQRSSANTNDLRGKIIRIHPETDGTYTIPDGNLFAPGTPGTRPEIYAMGFRNPFTIEVDSQTGALAVADYGPDANDIDASRGPDGRVEWNLVAEAGNYGWPYCVSDNVPYNDYDFATGESGPTFNCAAPVNESPNNTGLTNLPPAKPANVWYGRQPLGAPEIGTGGGPMAGPVYRFDESLQSDRKLPAYYDNSWFFLEWTNNKVYEFKLDGSGNVLKINDFLASSEFKRPMDMELGPDGALYLLEWGSGFSGSNDDSGLYRIDYVKGSRSPIARATANPDSGPVPLTVQFSSEGTRDPDGDSITLEWDFDSDGTVDSTEPNPTHTYTQAGNYTARLTVTDETGKNAVANVPITAGNTRPEVTLVAPVDGGFFDFGDQFAYQVRVADAEDGSTEDGIIDCSKVTVSVSLGHDAHGHPGEQYTGCEGVIQSSKDEGHGDDANLFYIVEASYTDSGAPGVAPLTGRDLNVLQPKRKQAEHFTRMSGIQTEPTSDPKGGSRNIGFITHGDWVSFEPMNLRNIDSLNYRYASAGTGGHIQVRLDAPDGPLVGDSGYLPPTGGWQTWRDATVPITDPGGTHELFFVFVNNPGNDGLFNINWIDFYGKGVSVNAKPRVTAAAEPLAGEEPFTVTFSASAVDPEGEEVTFEWDFGDGSTGTGAEVSHTYATRGIYAATVTGTDASGASGSDALTIEVLPPASPPIVCDDPDSDPGPDDEFDGDRLDGCRWDAVVRPDYNRFRVEDGLLKIDTTPTNLFDQVNNAPNLMLQTWPEGDWIVETKVIAPVCEKWQQGGILVYLSDATFLKFDIVGTADPGRPCSRKIEIRHEIGDIFQPDFPEVDVPDGAGDTWYLRLQKEGTTYTGYYSSDGENFTALPESVTNEALTGANVGLYGFGQEQTRSVTVGFDYFHKLDIDAPTVVAQLDPAEPNGTNGWYTSPVSVSLHADDGDGSGVESIEYALGDGPWTPYTEPFTVSDDGMHLLKYRAMDAAGNTSEESALLIMIDQAVPQTAANVDLADADGDGYSTHATVALEAADATSGVARTEYRIGEGEWQAYDGPFALGVGEHVVTFRSVDQAGNVEPDGRVTVRVSGDACSLSDLRAKVWTGDVNSQLENRDTGDGCTINDLIRDDLTWDSHGAFVNHVDIVTDALLGAGVITDREKGAILRAAARSSVGT